MRTRSVPFPQDTLLFSVRSTQQSIDAAIRETKDLSDVFPRRAHFLGTYRSIRDESLRGFVRAYVDHTANVLDGSYARVSRSVSEVDWLIHRLMRNGRELNPSLIEFSTMDAALLEARERVFSLHQYVPLVIRSSNEEDEVRFYGRAVHRRLSHVRSTLKYAREVADGAYRLLDSDNSLKDAATVIRFS